MADQLDLDPALLQDFVAECDELLEHLDQDLVALEASPKDTDLINRIFRAFHTIKGTSGFLGFQHVVRLTHQTEDLLNLMRKGERVATPPTMEVLLRSLDRLRQMLNDIRRGVSREYQLDDLLSQLKRLITAEEMSRPKLGEILVGEGAITEEERKAALEEAAKSHKKLGEVLVEKNLTSASQVREALTKQAAAADVKEATRTVRVDVAKLDDLVNLAGELVLERNHLAQVVRDLLDGRLQGDDLQSAVVQSSSRLSSITDELQSATLKARMMPIDVVFRRFPRMVRDLSHMLGKEVSLVLAGEDRELDRNVIEEISDPLVHILRNSLDHGIEPPDDREKKGKPRKGTLRVEASAEGDFIIVKVTDDGAGIDPGRVAAKAIERRIVAEQRIAAMSRAEILDLIFLPGFSTAEKTSDVSGRGVGMDVVRTNLKRLNGTVELSSVLGKGTTLTLKLPLTLAILPVLLVRVAQETFALPMRSVSEILRVDSTQVHRDGSAELLHVRDSVIPLGRVSRIFHLPASGSSEEPRLRVVVLSLSGTRLGLVVDDFLGREETVVKPLSSRLGHIPGVAGGAVSGEGRIRLILDPVGLSEMLSAGIS
ncbi:MAG TPA: chemotaxis protein CheA [Candidatus Acidoferrum sp.]|nr:chemotaxis protein CheA [Candidatus Acidoferrum sp.]